MKSYVKVVWTTLLIFKTTASLLVWYFVQMDQNWELYAYNILCMFNSYHIYGEETACVAWDSNLLISYQPVVDLGNIMSEMVYGRQVAFRVAYDWLIMNQT